MSAQRSLAGYKVLKPERMAPQGRHRDTMPRVLPKTVVDGKKATARVEALFHHVFFVRLSLVIGGTAKLGEQNNVSFAHHDNANSLRTNAHHGAKAR